MTLCLTRLALSREVGKALPFGLASSKTVRTTDQIPIQFSLSVDCQGNVFVLRTTKFQFSLSVDCQCNVFVLTNMLCEKKAPTETTGTVTAQTAPLGRCSRIRRLHRSVTWEVVVVDLMQSGKALQECRPTWAWVETAWTMGLQ